MPYLLDLVVERPYISSATLIVVIWLSLATTRVSNNIWNHPLAKFPGPKLAAVTDLWHAFVECILGYSFTDVLIDLHSQYGDVIRIGPNELHFANPHAYHDIYNNSNRWDKERRLYQSMGEDRSSFGYLTYAESKERKDVLNKNFSSKAIRQAEPLVQQKVDALCNAFKRLAKNKTPADISWAFRCMTMDVITYLSFGKSIDAIEEPNFAAPIMQAMDAAADVFSRFKHANWYKNMIMKCPPRLSRIISPATVGMVDLQQILGKQISEFKKDPTLIEHLPHNMTIYHSLMDKEAYKSGTVPSAGSLYEESQALMFGGGDTAGNTLLILSYYLMKNEQAYKALKSELLGAWPTLDEVPSLRQLGSLPYLNAVIREGLRMSNGVVAGLLRVVPPLGAKICDIQVPGGTIVSCASPFVHNNPDIFKDPEEFRPERWLENPNLEKNWLVAFSRGPRSCLGVNLAWMELRLATASVYRRFDLTLDPSSPKEMKFNERFLPQFIGPHVKATMVPVTA